MQSFKKQISMLLVCIVLVQAILPAQTVYANIKPNGEIVDGWRLTSTETVVKKNVVNSTEVALNSIEKYPVTLRKVNSTPMVYGVGTDYGNATVDCNYYLTQYTGGTSINEDMSTGKKVQPGDFCIYTPNHPKPLSYLNQINTLQDLMELDVKLQESGSSVKFSDIKICKQSSKNWTGVKEKALVDALKDIGKDWLVNNYIRDGQKDDRTAVDNIKRASSADMYFKSYTREELTKADTDLALVKDFYVHINTNRTKYLDPLIWLYNTCFEHKEANFDIEKKAAEATYSPQNDMERFIIYSLNKMPVDPAEAEKIRQEEQKQMLDSLTPASDITKFEDWCKAMAFIHEGFLPGDKYTSEFTDFKNMQNNIKDPYKKAQILTILLLPNSKQSDKVILDNYPGGVKSIQGYFNQCKIKNNIEAYKEIMAQALSNVSNTGEEDYADWTTRMTTFEDRINYLVCASYSGEEVDEQIEKFYTNPITTLSLNPEVSYINIGQGSLISGKYQVKNAQAYVYLVSTITEIYSISREVPVTIESYISNNTISDQRKYVEGIRKMHDGLRLIDSEEAWKLWTTPYDKNTPSLQEIYNKLTNLGAFDGLDITSAFSSDRPLGSFMNLDSSTLSPMYLKGVAYSATYLPMNTNVYDPYTLASYDEQFLKEFHYKYGFYRKALYIDTNASAAVDLHNTGRKGETKVCTLKNLLSCEKDIVLYIDDNFYNVNSLAEMTGTSFDRLDNVDEKTDERPWYEKLWSKVIDNFEVDIYEQTKTAEKTKYSEKLRKKIASKANSTYKADAVAGHYVKDNGNKKWVDDATGTPSNGAPTDNPDQYVLTSAQINDYLDGVTKTTKVDSKTGTKTETTTYDAYSVLMSYAVVSAVYRDPVLYTQANSATNSKPVFISSSDVACMTNTSNYEKSSIINYLLLKNLKANIPVGYNYNLDMNSPLYMDIYGNILTESGVVVVPAACNMTLFKDAYYKDLYNVGLFAVYGDDYSLPSSYKGVEEVLSSAFEIDTEFETWKVKSRIVDGEVADYARIATGDKEVAAAIQKQFEYNLSDGIRMYDFDLFFNIIMEVLRGAPIENIDKDFEGLNTNRRVSKAGLIAAAKLEELQKALDNGDANSILSIPNLAFMDGLEYLVVFLFKVLTFIVLLVMMITVYIDAVGTQFSWRTFLKCIWVVVLTVVTVVTIPTVFQLTYYQSNRMLLQKESAYIAMLNLEKKESGVEIGVYDVDVPDISTKLLIKLEEINVPWYDVFSQVMLSSTFNNLEEVYDAYAEDVPSSTQEDVTIMNDGVYMYVDDLFDSADINVDLESKNLYMRTDETLTASFYSPYYAILHSLVTQVNVYNDANNWYAYNTKMQKGGRLKTVGLITPYFSSTEFMDSEGDILSMCELHRVLPSMEMNEVFDDEEVEVMQESLWTNTTLSEDQTYKRVDLLSDYAREFVAENRNLLGKISDETFLKVMALSIAMKHNQLFGVTSADCFEIYNLSNEDLLRLSIADRDTVLSNSTLTYSRFVYEVGGAPAVYAAAILCMITWVSSYVKPICTILVFIAIFASLFIFKICLRRKTSNLYGYAITTILLCLCNLLHSILLKSSMYLPILKLSPTVCIILQSLLQLGYMAILASVTLTAFREWRDLGFDKYQAKIQKMQAKLVPRWLRPKGDNRYSPSHEDRHMKPRNNWAFYDRLVKTRKERNRR